MVWNKTSKKKPQVTRKQSPVQQVNKKVKEEKTICPHTYIVPLEFKYGKHKKNPAFDMDICDWTAAIMGAHRCRVYSYFCPRCKEVIMAPKAKVIEEK